MPPAQGLDAVRQGDAAQDNRRLRAPATSSPRIGPRSERKGRLQESRPRGAVRAGERPRRASCRWPPRHSGSRRAQGSAGAPASRSSGASAREALRPPHPMTSNAPRSGRLRSARCAACASAPTIHRPASLISFKVAREIGDGDHRRGLGCPRGDLAGGGIERRGAIARHQNRWHPAGIGGTQTGARGCGGPARHRAPAAAGCVRQRAGEKLPLACRRQRYRSRPPRPGGPHPRAVRATVLHRRAPPDAAPRALALRSHSPVVRSSLLQVDAHDPLRRTRQQRTHGMQAVDPLRAHQSIASSRSISPRPD